MGFLPEIAVAIDTSATGATVGRSEAHVTLAMKRVRRFKVTRDAKYGKTRFSTTWFTPQIPSDSHIGCAWRAGELF